MIKSIVIISLAISVLFASLADDIKNDMTQQSPSNELLVFRAESIKQCCNTAYIDYTGGKKCRDIVQYDSKKLDAVYTTASTAINELATINDAYKERLTNFINFQKNQNDNAKVFSDLKRYGIAEVKKDGQVSMDLPCTRAIESIVNTDKYKNTIKEEYTRVQILEAKRLAKENERIARENLRAEENIRREQERIAEENKKITLEKLYAEENIKIEQLEEILKKELCQDPQIQSLYTIERYDQCIKGGKQIWQKVDTLKKELTACQKLIDSNQVTRLAPSFYLRYESYEEYLKALQENRDYMIKEIQDIDAFIKKKNALIPEYKKWKKTIPAFQASLRPGTLVVGGIVTLVRDNLVEIDTGRRFIRQTRQQTFPLAPQHLVPLYYDETRGLKEY